MQKEQLSKNFTLSEMLHNNHNFVIKANNYQYDNLKMICTRILQPSRDIIKVPIIINSGLRDIHLNKVVGGVLNSQHLEGKAVDFKCCEMEKVFEFIRFHLCYDQVIVYVNENNIVKFIHVSYSENKNRKQALICKVVGNKKTYIGINTENLTYIRW